MDFFQGIILKSTSGCGSVCRCHFDQIVPFIIPVLREGEKRGRKGRVSKSLKCHSAFVPVKKSHSFFSFIETIAWMFILSPILVFLLYIFPLQSKVKAEGRYRQPLLSEKFPTWGRGIAQCFPNMHGVLGLYLAPCKITW